MAGNTAAPSSLVVGSNSIAIVFGTVSGLLLSRSTTAVVVRNAAAVTTTFFSSRSLSSSFFFLAFGNDNELIALERLNARHLDTTPWS